MSVRSTRREGKMNLLRLVGRVFFLNKHSCTLYNVRCNIFHLFINNLFFEIDFIIYNQVLGCDIACLLLNGIALKTVIQFHRQNPHIIHCKTNDVLCTVPVFTLVLNCRLFFDQLQ